MKKDYFAILGLKPTATDKEIRSAYKRLARKHHPDVNPGNKQAEEKFKEISEAYAVLSDPEKRRKWESGDFDFESYFRDAGRGGRRGGADPFAGIRFGEEGDLGGIFEDLFANLGGRGRRAAGFGAAPGADLQYEATIGFEEAVQGTTLRIPMARNTVCPVCRGEGRTGPGAGGVCPRCGGAGVQRVNETIHVRIPPGAQDGSKVRVAGKGEAGARGGREGDLYVVLRVTPHRFFRREGADVVLEVPLSMTEAALGTRIDVPTIDGRVKLTVPPGSSSGQRLRLKGRGVASRNGSSRGDQIVVLQIVTPRSLDARSRKLLEDLQRLETTDPRAGLGW